MQAVGNGADARRMLAAHCAKHASVQAGTIGSEATASGT